MRINEHPDWPGLLDLMNAKIHEFALFWAGASEEAMVADLERVGREMFVFLLPIFGADGTPQVIEKFVIAAAAVKAAIDVQASNQKGTLQ